jgi:hypothetical protein
MTVALTHFRVRLPKLIDDTPLTAFLASMNTLCDMELIQCYLRSGGVDSPETICQGYLTALQNATALGFLTTFNAALVAASLPAVFCTTNATTGQP